VHQQYEPIAAGEAGRLRLTQAIVAQHRAASGQFGAATTPSAATPNGSCLGTYYHATANVSSQALGAPNASIHLDQTYNQDPACNIRAYNFSYSRNGGASVVRVQQSLFFDVGGAPLGRGGDNGCAGLPSSGNFNGASAPLSDYNQLVSVANLSASCGGTSYDWDLHW